MSFIAHNANSKVGDSLASVDRSHSAASSATLALCPRRLVKICCRPGIEFPWRKSYYIDLAPTKLQSAPVKSERREDSWLNGAQLHEVGGEGGRQGCYGYKFTVPFIILYKEAGNSFQHASNSYFLKDEYCRCLTSDATITVSYKCPTHHWLTSCSHLFYITGYHIYNMAC